MKEIIHITCNDLGLDWEIMDHPFLIGGEPDKCVRCKRKEIDHTDLATCEACPNVGNCTLYLNTILLCDTCLAREKEHQSPEKQEERVKSYRENTIRLAKEIDNSVTNRSEYFNAETISIGALRDIIESDVTIENKRLALWEVVDARYKQLKQALITIDEQRVEKMNQIKASYEYMVTLSNQLTAEERQKYQIQDFNYKPVQVVTKPKSAPSKSNKFSQADLIKASTDSGIPMPALRTLCVRFNCNVAEAVSRFREATGT